MAKIGRNQPCPCGSGLKYKKCHGSPGSEATTEAPVFMQNIQNVLEQRRASERKE
jgi:hypothetical protein